MSKRTRIQVLAPPYFMKAFNNYRKQLPTLSASSVMLRLAEQSLHAQGYLPTEHISTMKPLPENEDDE